MRRAIDVLISVPFNWPAGSTKGQLHDPVDLARVTSWFWRKPNHHHALRKLFATKKGLPPFALFDPADPDRKFGEGIRKGRRPL